MSSRSLSKGSLHIEQGTDGLWRFYDSGVVMDTESELSKLVIRMFEHGDRLITKAIHLANESDTLRQRTIDILYLGRQAMERTIGDIENG